MLARKALAGTAGAPKEYVEDVFSTYLYTGDGSTQTITNNIDLSGKGGLVWIKERNNATTHALFDSANGISTVLSTNSTAGNTSTDGMNAFNNNGFAVKYPNTNDYGVNRSTQRYISWTFRKAKKFFDVVTYTGNGTTGRTVSHNLGSVPGCIIIKSTSLTENWVVYHRSMGNTKYFYLNTTTSEGTSSNFWNNTSPTSTTFTLGNDASVNDNSATYVAYLFAHDAGGFGDAGSDSIIKCASFDASSGAQDVDLGWEPQCVFMRESTNGGKWEMIDNMRGFRVGGDDTRLAGNSNIAENDLDIIDPLPNGFRYKGNLGGTVVYIAIRRGPMKTPETGTSVFTPTAFSGNDTSGTRSAGLNAFDLLITKRRTAVANWVWLDKLRGIAGDRWMASDSSLNERVSGGTLDQINTINGQYTQDGINITKSSNYSYIDSDGHDFVWYALKRAPKFFEQVCYTGTGSATTITHNLGVAPEMMFVKRRNVADDWAVYEPIHKGAGAVFLNKTNAYPGGSSGYWNSTDATSSVFSLGNTSETNASGGTYIAYLFASLSGVSKVGSYTGNGSSQTINCGFTNGARLVLIKRTDSTGDWFIYDTARGIVSGNDSQMKLNTDAAQATGYDAIDPDNSGFIVNNDATNFPINVNSASYIFLAIA